MSNEYGPNFITLTDDEGNNIELEYVACGYDGKLKIILGISVIAFITSLVGTILQVLSALNIHPF